MADYDDIARDIGERMEERSLMASKSSNGPLYGDRLPILKKSGEETTSDKVRRDMNYSYRDLGYPQYDKWFEEGFDVRANCEKDSNQLRHILDENKKRGIETRLGDFAIDSSGKNLEDCVVIFEKRNGKNGRKKG